MTTMQKVVVVAETGIFNPWVEFLIQKLGKWGFRVESRDPKQELRVEDLDKEAIYFLRVDSYNRRSFEKVEQFVAQKIQTIAIVSADRSDVRADCIKMVQQLGANFCLSSGSTNLHDLEAYLKNTTVQAVAE